MIIINQLKDDLTNYITQRDNAQINLQQAVGAIYATEQAIKKLQELDDAQEDNLENQAEQA